MSDTLVIRTPAKINLSLDITGKLPNGYHTMRSVFQTVGIYDTLTLCRTAPDLPMTLTCDAPDVPCDERNLVWKAAVKLLGEHPHGLAIHLEKRIPSQAGMGGGSSDCAAALMGIRKLFALSVSDTELHAIAASLGADCAFFLSGGTCYAGGIGEQITPLPDLPRYPLVIAKGTQGISTPEAYRKLDETAKEEPACAMDDVLRAVESGEMPETLYNSFERVILPIHPEAAQIRRDMLTLGAESALMSGSGPSVVGMFTEETQAHRCAEMLTEKGIRAVVCRQISAKHNA